MSKITWKIEKEEHQTQQVSADGRWHLSYSQQTGMNPKMFLLNMDLLSTPSALAENEMECYRKFIEECDEYSQRMAKIRAEAVEHLQQLTSQQGE